MTDRPAGLKDHLERRGPRYWQRRGVQSSFEPQQTLNAHEEIQRQLAHLTPRRPVEADLAATHRALVNSFHENQTLDGASFRDLRRAPWVLFYAPDEGSPVLGHNPTFVREYLKWLTSRRSPTPKVALLHTFLSEYPESSPTFGLLKEYLRGVFLGASRVELARWQGRCAEYHFLDDEAPGRLLEGWHWSRLESEAFLSDAGLAPGLEASRFVSRAAQLLAEEIAEGLRTDALDRGDLERRLGWFSARGELRHPDLRIPLAESLLVPFFDRKPGPDLEQCIREFLLTHLGDPRHARLMERGGWSGISDPARHVMMRWLVGQTLEDFFVLLDRTAHDDHWRYRKAFWSAYLDAGFIRDAWVALGPEAARIAKASSKFGSGEAAELRRGNGVQANHSVLIMRLDRCVIAEWSHYGKCRIWLEENRRAPRIYQAGYSRAELTQGADFEKTHHGSERWGWQHDVRIWIEEQLGTRIDPSAYKRGVQ